MIFRFSKILEKFHFSISKLFHFTFTFRSRFPVIFISLSFLDLYIKSFFSLALLEKSEWHFFFTFYFSIVQNPLSQDTECVKYEDRTTTQFDAFTKIHHICPLDIV